MAKKASHLLGAEDRQQPTRLLDKWIDIGARDRADVTGWIRIEDSAVIDSRPIELACNLYKTHMMDNRGGTATGLVLSDFDNAARVIAGLIMDLTPDGDILPGL